MTGVTQDYFMGKTAGRIERENEIAEEIRSIANYNEESEDVMAKVVAKILHAVANHVDRSENE